MARRPPARRDHQIKRTQEYGTARKRSSLLAGSFSSLLVGVLLSLVAAATVLALVLLGALGGAVVAHVL